MPPKDPDTYWKDYHAKNKLARNQQRAQHYQENLIAERQRRTRGNRENGFPERPKGIRSKPELFVDLSRRFRFFPCEQTGELLTYFTSKKGFSDRELREIMALKKKKLSEIAMLDADEDRGEPTPPKAKRARKGVTATKPRTHKRS